MTGVAGIVLAGGLSRRFGRDKAAAPLAGRALVEHVIERLPAPRAGTLLVVRRESAPLAVEAPVTIVQDDPGLPACALRGVVAGLEASPAAWAWVVACDMPWLDTGLLRRLAALRRDGATAVVPRWQGRLQPLAGLYARAAAPVLRRVLAGGELRLGAAVAALDPVIADEAFCGACDPHGAGFLNVNTPRDLAVAGSGPRSLP